MDAERDVKRRTPRAREAQRFLDRYESSQYHWERLLLLMQMEKRMQFDRQMIEAMHTMDNVTYNKQTGVYTVKTREGTFEYSGVYVALDPKKVDKALNDANQKKSADAFSNSWMVGFNVTFPKNDLTIRSLVPTIISKDEILPKVKPFAP